MPLGSGGRWAEDYERGRPGWPVEAVRIPRLPSDAEVLDLGAGTGKLTRLLTSAFARVAAVEPAEDMRRVFVALSPDVDLTPGAAEAIPLEEDSIDAVFVGQAFHKFEDELALAEIARVLRPGGTLVLLWNLPAGPWDPSASAAEELLHERMPPGDRGYIPLDLGGPAAGSGWTPAVADSPFEPLQAAAVANPQTVDRDGLVAFYATMDWVGDLPDDERLPLLAEVRALLTAPEYRRLWETHVHWARLR
jgi:SAM-dependent methyltransferase